MATAAVVAAAAAPVTVSPKVSPKRGRPAGNHKIIIQYFVLLKHLNIIREGLLYRSCKLLQSIDTINCKEKMYPKLKNLGHKWI